MLMTYDIDPYAGSTHMLHRPIPDVGLPICYIDPYGSTHTHQHMGLPIPDVDPDVNPHLYQMSTHIWYGCTSGSTSGLHM